MDVDRCDAVPRAIDIRDPHRLGVANAQGHRLKAVAGPLLAITNARRKSVVVSPIRTNVESDQTAGQTGISRNQHAPIQIDGPSIREEDLRLVTVDRNELLGKVLRYGSLGARRCHRINSERCREHEQTNPEMVQACESSVEQASPPAPDGRPRPFPSRTTAIFLTDSPSSPAP